MSIFRFLFLLFSIIIACQDSELDPPHTCASIVSIVLSTTGECTDQMKSLCPLSCGVDCPCVDGDELYHSGAIWTDSEDRCRIFKCENSVILADVESCDESIICNDDEMVVSGTSVNRCCDFCSPKLECTLSDLTFTYGEAMEVIIDENDICTVKICDPSGSGVSVTASGEFCQQLSCSANEYQRRRYDSCCFECAPKSSCTLAQSTLEPGEVFVDVCTSYLCDPQGSGEIIESTTECEPAIACAQNEHWRTDNGECCASCKRDQDCEYEGTIVRTSDHISHEADPCVYYRCDPFGSGSLLEYSRLPCNDGGDLFCTREEVYITREGSCCPSCSPRDVTHCSLFGESYDIGERWQDPQDPCLTYLCSSSGQALNDLQICPECLDGFEELSIVGQCCPDCISSEPTISPSLSSRPTQDPTSSTPTKHPSTSNPSPHPTTPVPTPSEPTHNPSSPHFIIENNRAVELVDSIPNQSLCFCLLFSCLWLLFI